MRRKSNAGRAWLVHVFPRARLSAWSLSQECTEFAVRALNLLVEQNKSAWDKSVAALLQSEMAKIPPRICIYLGERASSLTDDHASSLIGQMDAIIYQDQPEQDASTNYHQYVRSIPHETWSTPPWSEHLERLFIRTNEMHANVHFLALLLASVIHLFRAARMSERLDSSRRCSVMQPVPRTPTLTDAFWVWGPAG